MVKILSKNKVKKISLLLLLFFAVNSVTICGGCSSNKSSATKNPKINSNKNNDSTQQTNTIEENSDLQQSTDKMLSGDEQETENANAVIKEKSVYDVDFTKDRESFQADNIDIVVGDRLYATQINDWYMYPDKYIGKTVEIEGYYLYFEPYDFIGRNGPSCPYCNGGYVCFEILSDQDLSNIKPEKDWIKVQGILRKGMDSENGEFYYIEAINLEVMDTVGKSTVTD